MPTTPLLQYKKPITLELSTTGDVKFSVIWLHGLGSDGHDFESIVPQLNLPKNHGIRFIFPHANEQPVTANGGMKMRSWYDISSLNLRKEVDLKGMMVSADYITALINDQIEQGVPAQNILLAGFSQGGVIALLAGLQFKKTLAGVMALSTYFPNSKTLTKPLSQSKNVPIFMAHGSFDDICQLESAIASKKDLEQMGYRVDWFEYPMAHQVCAQEISEIRRFILSCFSR